jgi:hypothetical protein
MYPPPAFRETRPEVLHNLIRTHPLGLLITAGAGGILASPVPFQLVTEGGVATLRAHLSRANPQLDALSGAECLVVFQGPDAYVSPSWYATKRETGKVVPTWNYMIVQARGQARRVDDPAWLRADRSPDRGAGTGSRGAMGGRRRAGRFHRQPGPGDCRRRDRGPAVRRQMEAEPEPPCARPGRRRGGPDRTRPARRRGGGPRRRRLTADRNLL